MNTRRVFHLVSAAICIATAASCGSTSGQPSSAPADASYRKVEFPAGFRWGTASAAWQVEGSFRANGTPVASNWERWTQMGGKIRTGETNPRGSGFYEKYEQDLDTAQSLGTNAYRMGIEWARLEPQPDVWDEAEWQHYRDVMVAMRARGIQPMVTLWHWVEPVWISDPSLPRDHPSYDRYLKPDNAYLRQQFMEYTQKAVEEYGDLVDLWVVHNEPNGVQWAAYYFGLFPPGHIFSFREANAMGVNVILNHAAAYKTIHEFDTADADGDGTAAMVGYAHAANEWDPQDPASERDRRGAEYLTYTSNEWFPQAWVNGRLDVNMDGDIDDTDTTPPEGVYEGLKNTVDFIGVNYYGPGFALGTDAGPMYGLPNIFSFLRGHIPHSEFFGRIIGARGFLRTIERFGRFRLPGGEPMPIFITENGIADCDDNQRARYLTEHVYAVGAALREGIDMRGYYHWSLTDNFEWADGTSQCFGLVGIDYETLERTVRPSADVYRRIVTDPGRTIPEALFDEAQASGYGPGGQAQTKEEFLAGMNDEVRNGAQPER